MKVKCNRFRNNGDGDCLRWARCKADCEGYGFIEADIPSGDLMAELERQRPCDKCLELQKVNCVNCSGCCWLFVNQLKGVDKFKPCPTAGKEKG